MFKLVAAGAALAAVAGALPGLAGDYGLSPDEVAPGVHVLWGKQEALTPENGANIANTGFIVGTDSVLVIDAGPTARYAAQLRAAVSAITDRPISLVVVTHHHQDHSFGIADFVAAGHEVVMHAAAAPLLARDGETLLGFMTELVGETWTEGTVMGAPTRTITESITVDLGDRPVDIRVYSGGHTPGDLVVIDWQTQTMFAGDLVFNGRAATVPHADIATWRDQLSELGAAGWARLVPGHGPLVTDPARLEAQAAYLAFLEAHTACSYNQGDSPAEAIEADLPEAYAGLANIDLEFQRSVFQLFRKYDAGEAPPCP